MRRTPLALVLWLLGAAPLGAADAPSMDRARSLIERHCGDCAGATRAGLEDGIAELERLVASADRDRAAALGLLAEAYATLAFVFCAPDSPEQRDVLARRVRTLASLLEITPDDPDARYEHAMALGEARARIAGLRRVLDADPIHEDARFGLAMSLLDEGENSESLRLLRGLVASSPPERAVVYARRLYGALTQLGRTDEATALARRFDLVPTEPVRIAGEVSRGARFERELGRGLVFRLEPGRDAAGWTIEVRPVGSVDPEVELSWVATPPYRFWNPRYVDASYGYSAREAVAMDARDFSFVLDEPSYRSAAAAVRKLLWPHGLSRDELDRADASLERIATCRGRLRILDSRLGPAPAGGPLEIEWLKFEVELCS
jgi:hypothetical protein